MRSEELVSHWGYEIQDKVKYGKYEFDVSYYSQNDEFDRFYLRKESLPWEGVYDVLPIMSVGGLTLKDFTAPRV